MTQRVALVTGAMGGLGTAICQELAKAGHKVVAAYHPQFDKPEEWLAEQKAAGFDFVAKEGLAGAAWPVWMSDAFQDPGAAPATAPGGGPIFRWGNPEDCSTLGIDISDLIGVCRLEDGPTGPVSKSTWGPGLE